MKRLALWVVLGWLVGALINMGIVALAGEWMPPEIVMTPEDPRAWAGQLASLPVTFWLGPFLAHALGTLAGAAVAALGSPPEHRRTAAMIMGFLFAVGGFTMAWMMPAPLWLEAADLLLAYFPMAWIGLRLATRVRAAHASS
jgi:hypothetical protein